MLMLNVIITSWSSVDQDDYITPVTNYRGKAVFLTSKSKVTSFERNKGG